MAATERSILWWVGCLLVSGRLMLGCSVPAGGGGGTAPAGTVQEWQDDDADADKYEANVFSEDESPAMRALAIVPDELLLQVAAGADEADLQDVAAGVGGRLLQLDTELGLAAVAVDPVDLETAAHALADEALVEGVQKNYIFASSRLPDDPHYPIQTYLSALGLPDAWERSTGSEDIVVAVLDTGVAADHPDLSGRLVEGRNTWDDNDQTEDVYGHGTAVAGVLGAVADNRNGMAGVTWACPIMPIRVADADGLATSFSIARGLRWAMTNGATVANVSFAPLGADRAVHRAATLLHRAGGLAFISAGNDGVLSKSAGTTKALFVGAVDLDDAIAEFSTRGPFVDLVAPGVSIVGLSDSGGYIVADGTSFSSPIAAGVAALMWSVRPDVSPDTIVEVLTDTARDLGDRGRDDIYGAGLVDAAAAVERIVDVNEPVDTEPPSVAITRPPNGKTVGKKLVVTVAAEDDAEVTRVRLRVDGRIKAIDRIEPFRFVLRTSRWSAGAHSLVCEATDSAGKTRMSNEVEVFVLGTAEEADPAGLDTTPPVVAVTFPENGTVVSTTIGIQAEVSDDTAIAEIEWLVSGAVRQTNAGTGATMTSNFTWNATTLPSGAYTITIRATDLAGNTATAGISLVRG